MSDNQEQQVTEEVVSEAGQATEEPRKMSLAEAVKRKLEQSKQQAGGKQGQGFAGNSPKAMKSQMTKKPNNQRKRMGV